MGFEALFNWLINKIEELYPFNIVNPDQGGVHFVSVPFVGRLHRLFPKYIPKNGQWIEEVGPGVVARLPFMSSIWLMNVKRTFTDTDDIPIRTRDNHVLLISLSLKFYVHKPRTALLDVEDWESSLITDAHNIVALWADEHNLDEIRIQSLIDGCYDKIRQAGFRWGVTVDELGINSLAEQDVHYVRGIEIGG